MILILMIPYVVLIVALVKMRVLKPTLPVKLSPIAWLFFLLLVFFIPMLFWAPMGDARIISAVVPIVPNVKGTVVEIPITANVPLKEGDVLFRIDPRPFQYQVDKLESMLVGSNASAAQIESRLRAAEAATAQARSQLLVSESDFDRQAREDLEQAEATVRQTDANLKLAQVNLDRSQELFKEQVISQGELDKVVRDMENLKAQRDQADAARRRAEENLKAGGDRLQTSREALHQAEAREQEARIAYESESDGMNPQVRQILADLDNARWELEQTTVRAPADGYVTNMAIRPGAMAVSFPMHPAMAFVTEEKEMVLFVKQTNARLIRPAQDVEIALDLYPGKIFDGKVMSIVEGSSQGQVINDGGLASAKPEPRGPMAIIIEPGEELSQLWTPPGVGGQAAIYTGKGKYTYIIRRITLRMYTWLNFVR